MGEALRFLGVQGLMLLLLSSQATMEAASSAALLNPRNPTWREVAPSTYQIQVMTNKGNFVIEVHRIWAPHGADRFYNLVRNSFFDDSRFFRVRAGFIAQFGISGSPKIAALWRDEKIPDDPPSQSNIRGTIAFAMTGPNTRTTQLFINLADNSRLDAQGFAPIGKVVEGMEVVDQLFAGYGEEAGGGMRGGKQDKLFEGGNEYLDLEFPKLDKLFRASVVEEKKHQE